MENKTCCRCEGKHYGRGLCAKHYQQDRLGGAFESFPKCSFDGCGATAICKSFCARHYQRFKKYGDASKIKLGGAHKRFHGFHASPEIAIANQSVLDSADATTNLLDAMVQSVTGNVPLKGAKSLSVFMVCVGCTIREFLNMATQTSESVLGMENSLLKVLKQIVNVQWPITMPRLTGNCAGSGRETSAGMASHSLSPEQLKNNFSLFGISRTVVYVGMP